ncbi:hypothetical protein DWC19_18920 [Streptomyces sp. M7]|nr:hypothetical protein DWC19_18920 [Streptomyces sp. M7]
MMRGLFLLESSRLAGGGGLPQSVMGYECEQSQWIEVLACLYSIRFHGVARWVSVLASSVSAVGFPDGVAPLSRADTIARALSSHSGGRVRGRVMSMLG